MAFLGWKRLDPMLRCSGDGRGCGLSGSQRAGSPRVGFWARTPRPGPVPTGCGPSDPDTHWPGDVPRRHGCLGAVSERRRSHRLTTSRAYGVSPKHIQKVIRGNITPHVTLPKIKLQAAQTQSRKRQGCVGARQRTAQQGVSETPGTGGGVLCPAVPSVLRERTAKTRGREYQDQILNP